MPLPQLWAVLFFFMMFILGMGSQFGGIEAINTAIIDFWPHLRHHKWRVSVYGTWWREGRMDGEEVLLDYVHVLKFHLRRIIKEKSGLLSQYSFIGLDNWGLDWVNPAASIQWKRRVRNVIPSLLLKSQWNLLSLLSRTYRSGRIIVVLSSCNRLGQRFAPLNCTSTG